MSIEDAFDTLQTEVNVKDRHDEKARARRDVFKTAFDPDTRDDVTERFASGSLARGTQIDPIHDVDMVVVYDQAAHPEWGSDGDSAEDALEEVRKQIHELLGQNAGTVEKVVRRADLKNHSVKCFLDDPGAANAFTVDLVPALRHEDGHLLIPERNSKKWVTSDPEYLIDEVAARHDAWPRFAQLVRVLKRWNTDNGKLMKSLVVEVLALEHLPNEDSRALAVHKFFTAAAARINVDVEDPSGHCGTIQPDLDKTKAYDLLDAAASSSWKAVQAEARGDIDEAKCHWNKLFGDIFPAPPGGCPEDTGTGTGLIIGTTAAAAVIPAPKKIIDAPQG